MPGEEKPASNKTRVGEVTAEDFRQWSEVLLMGFGMPTKNIASMLEATAGHASHDFVAFAAWDGPDMVAAVTLFMHRDRGAMFGASTLPSHRNRGAQSALLRARIDRAASLGATWISAETGGAEASGKHNPSLHNMRRAGLDVVYERPNWIWQRS